jgi:hypothetical protein
MPISPAGDRDQVYGECFHLAASRYRLVTGRPANLAPRASMPKRAGVKHDPWRRITLIPWKETLGYR